MKKYYLKIWITLLAACALFIATNAIIGRAAPGASNTASSAKDYCAVSFNPVYNDEDKSLEDIMVEYHKNVNDIFNENIKKMITTESAAAKNIGVPDPGQAPRDKETGAFLPCPADNYSTYCVAEKIMNDEKRGYIAYVRALECRRGKLFDTKTEEIGYTDFLETTLSVGLSNPAMVEAVAGGAYQTQKAMEISARMEAIDREKSTAKSALDQTLSAYNQLRIAWPMHKKYVQIYNDLIKYRDKMVEIRKQVEEFPSRFIDASTTKCT